MSRKTMLFYKVVLSVAGLAIIFYILAVSIRMGSIKQPHGEYIRLQDALILTDALDEAFRTKEAIQPLRDGLAQDADAVLTYEQFLVLINAIGEKPGNGSFTDAEGNPAKDVGAACEKQFGKKYKKDFLFLKDDWYHVYERLIVHFDLQSAITRTEVTVLGVGQDVTDEEDVKLADDRLLSPDGTFFFRSDEFRKNKYRTLGVWQKDGTLLTISNVVSRGYSLHNIWIVEAEEEALQVFNSGYEIRFPYPKAETGQREQIADLEFADGTLQSVRIKPDKVNGKLLSVRDGKIELEGGGKYPYREDLRIYRLYGKMSECGEEELRIGYDFTDFVLEDGVICAALITRDEAMENIRVVIKNTGFAGPYHDRVELTADSAFQVSYGSFDSMNTQEFAAGETLSVDADSEYFTGDRIYIEPAVRTGKLTLLSVDRAQGTPSYRGKMEIAKTGEGLVLVNEVLLEEYLYSVVPSEMPASYPLESLKAQAVCARTYAYRHMLHSGIAQFGAHVDDSAGYQVYNNIAENAQSTRAVKETSGQLLYYGEELCGSYYYSTSCGFGTDINIWKTGNGEDTSYLSAKRIGTDTSVFTGENMTEKGTFEAFIAQVWPEDYESKEPWYRWTYQVDSLNPDTMLAAIQARYEANDQLVLTREKDGSFVSKPVKKLGKIKELTIEKRNAGGVADELLVVGTENTYKIISEHYIRYVLNDKTVKVIRQDGSETASPTLLPSGYFTITTGKEDDIVVGYTLTGGGYGHGVGMSQNGARDMAHTGMDAKDILTFFYRSCEVKKIY